MKKATLLQFFHWYYPDGGKLWPEATERAPELAELGITAVWLPPPYKGASGGYSVGYDSYDLFDLGEFEQKGSRATKYGDKEGLLKAVNTLKENGLEVYLDVVLNHKIGADETEQIKVSRVDPDDRNIISDDVIEAKAYTRFTFPGRKNTYSEYVWDFHSFNGVDYLDEPREEGIFKIVNDYTDDGWVDEVDSENGNYDYLMGANIEFRNPAVMEELKRWVTWLMDTVPSDGFRLDAVKHIPAWFFKQWLDHARGTVQRDLFTVAEYWSHDLATLQNYLELVDDKLMLFDAPLHLNFHHASQQGKAFDLSKIFADTLTAVDATHSVTLVANHDTQPLQALETPVEPWFKPLAYSLILLREQGVPCIFYPDLFGASYRDKGHDGKMCRVEMPAIRELPLLIRARQRFANGQQTDYFDSPNCIAFVREGTAEEPGCVVVLSNDAENSKLIELGEELANKQYRDYLGIRQDTVVTDEQGKGVFPVNASSVSVWVLEEFMEEN
ncbi:alpha-amylase [Budviciaceae bacterium BWR-B9]|uniref:Alpha-amylase n=1 Tax=Limnobaculum allomyrinae TaxID=2791986 RepID=A0ABS1IRS1_9GAMM|nr:MULTISPECIES: alpha-amylase [Limnobaculum]MBK5144237.1 alpha-amylase [Limnobaculum allomyrinae]MBV7692019.1 alpha-amylase [Limnobaculum sp. M2-1]